MKYQLNKEKFKALHFQQFQQSVKKYTILLVDDEEENLQLVASILKPHYHILTASDGQAALDLIKNDANPSRIQCIIADQRMPQMTGVELLKQTILLIPKTIRMILTAYKEVDVILEAVNEGHVYKFLTKPIDSVDLEITVKRALEAYELDDISSDEERFNVIGMAHGRLLYVVYTWRGSKIRIISARKTEKYEEKQYHNYYR